MKKFKLALAVSVVLLGAGAAYAKEELAPGYSACMDASGGVTAQIQKCQSDAYIYLDGRLNTNYKQAMRACNNEADPKACKATVLKMQRAWIKYKEATADYLFMAHGDGSFTPIIVDDFVNGTTKTQGDLLEVMVDR